MWVYIVLVKVKTANEMRISDWSSDVCWSDLLSIGVSAPFQKQHPDIAEFFSKVDLPIEPLNKALADMSEKHTPPREAAVAFLKAHPQVWQARPDARRVGNECVGTCMSGCSRDDIK